MTETPLQLLFFKGSKSPFAKCILLTFRTLHMSYLQRVILISYLLHLRIPSSYSQEEVTELSGPSDITTTMSSLTEPCLFKVASCPFL